MSTTVLATVASTPNVLPTTSSPAVSTGSPTTRLSQHAGALLQTARPKQWLKNVLVLAAPAAAGTLLSPAVAIAALWAAGAFVLASAGTYFINDAQDAAADRAHPIKAHRPVASGAVSVRTAYILGASLATAALLVSVPVGWPLTVVLATYLATTTAYSRWLKHQPVIDIMIVAAGFVLRTVAGAVATGTMLSNYFLLVALFGALFVVTAKRSAEHETYLATGVARSTVQGYPASWLQQVLTVCLAGTVLTYANWALQYVGSDVSHPMLELSVAPFLAVMLRYSLLVSLGAGEAPEDLVTDRFLLLAGAAWAVSVGGALYLV